jgi:AcrR family transcriptional regulator
MSGEPRQGTDPERIDRRIRKTRRALVRAFSELVQDRRYEEIRVADIVGDADVGRSTFYDHFRGKDDLLLQSMAGILDVLAEAACGEGDPARLQRILSHLWDRRRVARPLLAGPSSRHVADRLGRALADRIETRLASRLPPPGHPPVLPLRLVARQAAESQLALIRAWLSGEAPCTTARLAAGLRRSALGSVAALLPEHDR